MRETWLARASARASGAGSAPVAVVVGVRPQHITLDPSGATHRVELSEQLGGVSYVYLQSESGERLIVEAREGVPVPVEGRIGISYDASKAMLFNAKTEARLR